jgi:hypothetical protein
VELFLRLYVSLGVEAIGDDPVDEIVGLVLQLAFEFYAVRYG